jgi:hypothetical protein
VAEGLMLKKRGWVDRLMEVLLYGKIFSCGTIFGMMKGDRKRVSLDVEDPL